MTDNFIKYLKISTVLILVHVKLNNAHIFNKYIHPMAVLNVSYVQFNKKNDVILLNSALYNVNSNTNDVRGDLVDIFPDNGCSQYRNKYQGNYIALVGMSGCTIEQKINVASQNNARALIVINSEDVIHLKIACKHNFFYSKHLAPYKNYGHFNKTQKSEFLVLSNKVKLWKMKFKKRQITLFYRVKKSTLIYFFLHKMPLIYRVLSRDFITWANIITN